MKKINKIPCEGSGIEIKKTVCAICDPSTQCGLSLYIKDGKVIKIEGDEDQFYAKGTLCPKGAANRQYLYNEERIQTPLRRVGPKGSGEFVPISWDEAYEEIAENFNKIKKEVGAESVVFASGYTKYYRPWLKRLCHSFGSPNYVTESSSCYLGMWLAQKLVFGDRGDPDYAGGLKCLLVWSSNPFYSSPGNARRLLASLKDGLKLIVVDPRRTPTTEKAHIHLRLRPGTDGALALAMAHVLITENLYNKEFVENYTYGFEEYRDYVMEYPPERGEEITGVPADLIREAARMFAQYSPSAVLPSAAPVVHHTNGVQNYRAVFSLVGLLGNFDVEGGQKVTPVSFLHGPGQFTSRQSEFRQSRPYSEMAPRLDLEAYPTWHRLVNEEAQGMDIPQQIRSGKPYPLKGMFALGLNHRMWADSSGMADALTKLDFFVNVDIFLTDTCKLADLVLPACTSMERSEFRCWGSGHAVCTSPAIPPLFQSKPDIQIMCELAKYIAPEDTLLASGFDATLDWILQPSGMTAESLRKYPSGTKVPNPQTVGYRKYLDGGFHTPSGKLEFVSKVLEDDPKAEVDALPTYRPPKYSKEATPEMAKDYPMILNTGSRLPMFLHTRTYRLPWIRSLRPQTPEVELHPADGIKYNLKNGEEVRVSTPKGSVLVKVSLTTIAMEGVVHIYHGFNKADVNDLLDGDYKDPISGYPGYKGALCRIDKL